MQTHSATGFCGKTSFHFLFWYRLPCPRTVRLAGHFFWFLFISQKRGWWKFWVSSPWLYVNTHFAFNVIWNDDLRYKVMESQDQTSRRFVDHGASSLHFWDHIILFQVSNWRGNSWEAMGFITTWLAHFRVKCLVFPKQCGLKPFDEEMENNMQKISTIVHIWLKTKGEKTSEEEIIWFFLSWYCLD